MLILDLVIILEILVLLDLMLIRFDLITIRCYGKYLFYDNRY